MKNIGSILVACLLAGGVSPWAAQSEVSFKAAPPAPPLLPGQNEFAFSLYGCPGNVEELKQLVEVMREKHLGSAFDPGPSASASSRPILQYLASIRWPVVCYPPDGARTHDRGTPYTPLLVVLDHLAGYAPYHQLTWGILPRTPGDQEIYDLFEVQLFHNPQRLLVPGNPLNPEAGYLHPTRYGEFLA